MLGACGALLFRSSFLTIATPLLLGGALLSQVSLQLQLASIANLEYAATEEAAALACQQQASKNVAIAALDQVEADELEADAARLEGKAVVDETKASEEEETAGATEEGSEEAANTVDVADGADATATAVEGAGDVEGTAEVAAAVEEAARHAAETMATAGEAAESGAVAAGATAAEATAAGVAVEGVAVGGAAAGSAVAGVTAGTVAVTGVALGVTSAEIAVEGPKAVAAAKDQWAAASDEVQAAGAESLATEKEAEVAGLELSVPVYEGSALAAHQAAAGSLATAGGYLMTAQSFQLLSLACQAPVSLIVLMSWFSAVCVASSGGVVTALRACSHSAAGGGSLTASPALHDVSYLIAGAALSSALLLALAGPWADTVIQAAGVETGGGVEEQLASLPALIGRALPSLGAAKKNETSELFASIRDARKSSLEDHGGRKVPTTTAKQTTSAKPLSQEQSRLQDMARETAELQAQVEEQARARLLAEVSEKLRETGLWSLQGALDYTGGIVEGGEQAAEGAVKVTEGELQEAVNSTEGKLKEADGKLKEAVNSTEGELQEAESVAEVELEEAESVTKGKVEEAENVTKSKVEEAESVTKSKVEEAESVTKSKVEEAESVTKSKVEEAESVTKGKLEEAEKETTGTVSTELQETVNITESAVHEGQHAAGVATENVKEAVIETKEEAIDVAKNVIIKKPNTATTTVQPLTTQPPPATKRYSCFFGPGVDHVKMSATQWAAPVVEDLAMVSVVFVFYAVVVGFGRHLPAVRCGCEQRLTPLGRFLQDICATWLQGTAILLAIWVLSIILAAELKPLAEQLQDAPFISSTSRILGVSCVIACCFHAFTLSRLKCPCKCGQSECGGQTADPGGDLMKCAPFEQFDGATPFAWFFADRSWQKLEDPENGEDHTEHSATSDDQLLPKENSESVDDEKPSKSFGTSTQGLALTGASWLCAILFSVGSVLLSAVEGPLFSWAVGSSYRSAASSWWLLQLVPLELIAMNMFGWRRTPVILLVCLVVIFAFGIGMLLHFARSAGMGQRRPRTNASELQRRLD